jgi:ketosteroid isomerase-like protein
MSQTEQDRADILAVHERWMDSAVGLRIDEMRQCFVQGKHLDMWNLNGHAYFGVDELAQLWRHLQTVYDLTLCCGDSEPNVTIMGDMALVTWERMRMDTKPKDGSPMRHRRMRGTEVYRRDDGAGNKRWTIWHCHYSDRAPEGDRRPGF